MHICVDRTAKPALRHLWMVRIPFGVNQNLSSFCMNTKRTGCARYPFYAPGVLCSPQVSRKLINRAPDMCRMRTAQHINGMLVYTRFKNKMFLSLNLFPSVWHFSTCFSGKTDVLLNVHCGSDGFILTTWTLSPCETQKVNLMKYIPQHFSVRILKFPVFVFHQLGLSSLPSKLISRPETMQVVLVRYLFPT